MAHTWQISVVIRTYTDKRWDFLVGSVDSVLAQTLPPLEVVLVVDHNPALAERVRQQWAGRAVNVVENPGAQGSSGAWNAGIDAAQGDLIAFIDDDAMAAPNWLEELVKPYADPNVLGVGGTITPNWLTGRPTWFPDEFNWVVGCTYRGLPETTAPVRNLIGCNMSFRREPMNVVRFYEDKGLGHMSGLPVGCDETELCIRMGNTFPGKFMLHHPPAEVQHQVPGSRATWAYFRQRCALEGRSKAVMSGLVGTQKGLETERRYVLVTLPTGVLQAILKGNLPRAGAIIGGLAITAWTYLKVKLNSASAAIETPAATPAPASGSKP